MTAVPNILYQSELCHVLCLMCTKFFLCEKSPRLKSTQVMVMPYLNFILSHSRGQGCRGRMLFSQCRSLKASFSYIHMSKQ